MLKTRRLFVILRLFAVLFAVVIFFGSCKPKAARLNGPAPDFTLKDVNGASVSLSSLKGNVVLLEFWATWCPSCESAVPELIALHNKTVGKKAAFVTVSIDKDPANLKPFIKAYNVPFTVLIDDGKVSDVYGVTSIPTLFLIDKDGRIAKKYLGFAPGMSERLYTEMEALL